jgi:carbon-monoxide dehydrogenase medium subunit
VLDWLRDDVGLTGTKEGCAEGECGACTVNMDGAAVLACLVAAPRAHGAVITTVEGLAADGVLSAVQQAFVDQFAVQCGFCIPGFVMAADRLLAECPAPSREQVAHGLSGNLCRCTGYYRFYDALDQAMAQAARE